MASFHIVGQQPLRGNLVISGRKNAALKLIAASILSDKPVVLRRIPDIGDVASMLAILEAMGAIIERNIDGQGTSVRIDTSQVNSFEIPFDLAKRLRASIVLVGPLLGRFGRAVFPHPGGCIIGKRSIMPHLHAFESLGAKVEFANDRYHLTAEILKGANIYLKEKSVTGTENAIMAAVRAQGVTNIFNAAEERHIVVLAEALQQMGYQINGQGGSHICIEGQPELTTNPIDLANIADEIEVGTFAVATVLTGGEVTLEQVGSRLDLLPILSRFDDMNFQYAYAESVESLTIYPSPELKATDLQVNPWPGFPSDLQSPFTTLATQINGTSLIHDWMFEGRLYFVALLQQMGAQIVICDPHRVLVTGPTPLRHSTLLTPDLRAGAALVLAALAAEGTSVIEHAELIERGYDHLDERLRSLGANIQRI